MARNQNLFQRIQVRDKRVLQLTGPPTIDPQLSPTHIWLRHGVSKLSPLVSRFKQGSCKIEFQWATTRLVTRKHSLAVLYGSLSIYSSPAPPSSPPIGWFLWFLPWCRSVCPRCAALFDIGSRNMPRVHWAQDFASFRASPLPSKMK